MLVATQSRAKSKFPYWIFIPLIIFILVVPAVYFYYPKDTGSPLLSPFFGTPKPDLSEFLQKKITPLPPLDYSKAQTLITLSDQLNYLVYNPKTFRVYAAKNADRYVSPASFTKLLSTQVALDLFSVSQNFTVTENAAAKEPTILGLKIGEQLTVGELVRAAISTSANDATAVIGEGISLFYKQERDFTAELMNQKVALLGMTHSHFKNPEGYDDEDQYTTLTDIARLVHNAQNYPEIISAGLLDRHDLVETATHGFYYLPNWNGLLNVYPGVTGLKIAYTDKAGYATIVTCERNGVNVVVILTGADSIPERDLAAAALLDAGFMAEKQKPIKITKAKLQPRYQEWADLSAQIRATLTPTP